MPTAPAIGSDAWFEWIEELQGEVEKLRRVNDELKSRLRDREVQRAASEIEDEAKRLRAEEKLRTCESVVMAVLNDPLRARTEVQSNLTLLAEKCGWR